jgi:excisionase family DNA binding protein
MERLLKLQEAADRLGISRSRLYTLASRGKIPCVRIAGQGQIKFRVADIEEQLKPRTPTPDLVDLRAEADDGEPTPDLGITPEEMEVMLRAAFKALAEVREGK